MNLKSVLALALLGAAIIAAPAAAEAQERQRREEAARAPRGWIGISMHTDPSGETRIEEVYPGSPAERAGLRAGDVLLRWNDRTDIPWAVRGWPLGPLAPGDTVRLRILRDGREQDVVVVAESRPRQMVEVVRGRPGEREVVIRPGELRRQLRIHGDSLAVHADSLHQRLRVMLRDSLGPRLRRLEEMELPELRFRIQEADSALARELGNARALAFDFGLGGRAVAGAELTEVNPGLGSYFGTDRGLLVLRVAPETPAARAGLREGDVVVRAGDQEVASIRDLRQAVARAQARELDLEVLRRGSRSTLRLSWER